MAKSNLGEIKVDLKVDTEEAIKELKRVQREAKKATQAMKELEELKNNNNNEENIKNSVKLLLDSGFLFNKVPDSKYKEGTPNITQIIVKYAEENDLLVIVPDIIHKNSIKRFYLSDIDNFDRVLTVQEMMNNRGLRSKGFVVVGEISKEDILKIRNDKYIKFKGGYMNFMTYSE